MLLDDKKVYTSSSLTKAEDKILHRLDSALVDLNARVAL